ncbi:MAG: MaoC family dehydratase [Alphaproteobacteria bacterium]|nr:MaoC family dehydratase [Alphaproteobacteria bacterium]
MSAGVSGAIAEGDRLPVLSRRVSQAVINAYAEASGDFNPIHTDPDYASKGPFGRTIAHGMMTLAYASDLMSEWAGEAWLSDSAIDVAFLGPVFAGDDVTVTGVVREIVQEDAGPTTVCELTCQVGDRTVMAGSARCRIGAS